MLIKKEYLDRPTDPAGYWPDPDAHVLGGRDLLRPEHGTWLGATKQGRIAVLTNYREEDTHEHPITGTISRGAMVNAWLKQPPDSKETTKEFVDRLFGVGDTGSFKGVGGFSLVFGLLRKEEDGINPLAVVSNRTQDANAATWIASSRGQTYGLSNSAYDDPWPKVLLGKSLLDQALKTHVESGQSEDHLVEQLFTILSHNSLPAPEPGQSVESQMKHMRESIFVPALRLHSTAPLPDNPSLKKTIPSDESGVLTPNQNETWRPPVYGTQKQTVILVRKNGRIIYIEKTLFDKSSRAIEETRHFEFDIDGWTM